MDSLDVFTFRDSETITVTNTIPNGLYLMVQLRPSHFPPGPIHKPDNPRESMKNLGVIACGLKDDGWYWITLSAQAKVLVGNLMVDAGCELDHWYYLSIKPKESNNVTIR